MALKLHRTEYRQGARGPLDDVRVLDLSRLVAGNIMTHVLADLGAEVIKIEKPGRATTCATGRPRACRSGGRSMRATRRASCLDLRSEAGREVLLRLVEGAQVLVENFRPGTLERMGLGAGGAARAQSQARRRAHLGLGPERLVAATSPASARWSRRSAALPR